MPKQQKPLCKFYQSAKGCKFGAACKFRHEEASSKPNVGERHFTGFAREVRRDEDEEPDIESFMRNSFPQGGAPPFPLFLQMMMNSMQLDDEDDEFYDEDEFDEEYDDEDDFEEDELDDDLLPGNNPFGPNRNMDAVKFLLSQLNGNDDSDEEEEEEPVPSKKSLPQKQYEEDTTIAEEEAEIFSLQAQPPFCATCGKRFKTKEEAKQHMIDAGHWFCPQCGVNFKSSVLYLAHRDARHLSAESQDYIIYLQNDPFAETFKNAHPIQNNLCMRLLCNIYLNYGLPLWKETNIQSTIKKIIDQIFMHELTIRAIREQPFPLPPYLEFSDMIFNPTSPFKANQEYRALHKQCQESFAKVFKNYVLQSNTKTSVLKMTRTERTRFVSSNYFQAWLHHPNLSQWSKNTNDTINVNLDIVLGWEPDVAPHKTTAPPTATSQPTQQANNKKEPLNNNNTSKSHAVWDELDDDKPQIAKKSTQSPTKQPQPKHQPKQTQSSPSKPQPQTKPAFNFSEPANFNTAPFPGKPFSFAEPSSKSPTPTTSQPSVPPTKASSTAPSAPVKTAATPTATPATTPAPQPAPPNKASDDLGACFTCGQPASSRCSRCKAASYCGAACQKAHWETHKKTCGTSDNKNSNNSNSVPKSSQLLWYANLDKKAVYQRFIDSYRLRVDDDYVWGSNIHGLYASEDPLPDFKKYLQKAKQAKVLPSFWKSENDAELIEMATTHDWANINYAVEKSDIIDHYGFGEHLVLRMLAQQICGDF